ncbi:hypothetical protein FQN50_008159 [Emmonsiellopsis sp. PD_5]|nr:hypothetical protein FQN50_008159 [Emmonsiellopsis sp. PD_5]
MQEFTLQPGTTSSSSPESPAENSTMPEQRRRFLEHLHLPPDVSEYEYSGLDHLREMTERAYDNFITNNTQSPFVVFTNLPPEEFEQFKDTFKDAVDYSPHLQLLILTMVSAPHEAATEVFGGLVRDKARENGVRRKLSPRGRTETETPERWKGADCSWIPHELPPGRTRRWPSVALEVGYAEPREKLKRDMEFWLNASNNEVKMALSIDIKRPGGDIFFTTWKRGIPVPPRASSNPEPQAMQEIKIERGRAGQQQPNITGSNNLVIPFQSIMLRQPGQGEGDFVFTREDLLEVAEEVWLAMDS